MISVRGLSKRHGTREVLTGVDADLARGEVVAIVGPSGAGKTTLLRCLNYLEPFDAGTIDIAGFRLLPGMVHARASTRRRCAGCAPRSAWSFSSSTCSRT